jgi:hypothetical protein
MAFKAMTMIAARHAFGNDLNRGPKKRITIRINTLENIPPTLNMKNLIIFIQIEPYEQISKKFLLGSFHRHHPK